MVDAQGAFRESGYTSGYMRFPQLKTAYVPKRVSR
jgi:hypothetical protein